MGPGSRRGVLTPTCVGQAHEGEAILPVSQPKCPDEGLRARVAGHIGGQSVTWQLDPVRNPLHAREVEEIDGRSTKSRTEQSLGDCRSGRGRRLAFTVPLRASAARCREIDVVLVWRLDPLGPVGNGSGGENAMTPGKENNDKLSGLFTKLQKRTTQGGWTFIVWPESVHFWESRLR